jgi:hypothetical protein
MKITVTRSGGFAGIVEDLLTVDTEELDASLAEQVQQLVSKAGLFSLPEFVSGGEVGADYQRYDIEVAEGELRRRVQFQDDDSPQTVPLRKLVNDLRELAGS